MGEKVLIWCFSEKQTESISVEKRLQYISRFAKYLTNKKAQYTKPNIIYLVSRLIYRLGQSLGLLFKLHCKSLIHLFIHSFGEWPSSSPIFTTMINRHWYLIWLIAITFQHHPKISYLWHSESLMNYSGMTSINMCWKSNW